MWRPGESGNPNGRPKGARNKRNEEFFSKLEERGDKDPADLLSEIVSDPNEQKEFRIQAAGLLLPYKYAKLGSKPTPPDPVYVEQAINLPRPTTIRQAYENIALLSDFKATGKIDIATADSLIEDQKVILYALIDEAKLLTAQGGSPEQTIKIEGGLPRLPGTSVIMPSDPPYEPGFQDPGMDTTAAKGNGHDTEPTPPESSAASPDPKVP